MKNEIKKLVPICAALALLVFVLWGCNEDTLPHNDSSSDTAESNKAPVNMVNIEDIRENIEQIFIPQKEDFALDTVLIARYDGQNGAEYSVKCIDGIYETMREDEWRAYASCVISEDVFGRIFELSMRDPSGISALGFTDDEMATEQWAIELINVEASAAVCEALEIVCGEMENNPTVRFVNNSDGLQ